MDEVATNLFIGSIENVEKTQPLREHGITTTISLTHADYSEKVPVGMDMLRHPMVDGPQADFDTFARAVRDAVTALRDGDRVLVCCSAGASRSPAVAATALAVVSDLDLNDAFQQVSSRRPVVDPHEALVQYAARVYTER
jgi:protein-tyrosine phosphatase